MSCTSFITSLMKEFCATDSCFTFQSSAWILSHSDVGNNSLSRSFHEMQELRIRFQIWMLPFDFLEYLDFILLKNENFSNLREENKKSFIG